MILFIAIHNDATNTITLQVRSAAVLQQGEATTILTYIYIYIYTYVYIYIYIVLYMCMYVYIYIYTYMYIYIYVPYVMYIYRERERNIPINDSKRGAVGRSSATR